MSDKAIMEALGVESAFGYHVEDVPRLSFPIAPSEHRPATWYPCLDALGRYSGCLGVRCPLEVCWTGTPTVSYAVALEQRFTTTDADYAPGARCPCCRHLEETSVPVLDGQRGLVHLPMLHCGKRRWIHPINPGALARRRIPARPPTDLAYCGKFDPVEQLHPDVIGTAGTPTSWCASGGRVILTPEPAIKEDRFKLPAERQELDAWYVTRLKIDNDVDVASIRRPHPQWGFADPRG